MRSRLDLDLRDAMSNEVAAGGCGSVYGCWAAEQDEACVESSPPACVLKRSLAVHQVARAAVTPDLAASPGRASSSIRRAVAPGSYRIRRFSDLLRSEISKVAGVPELPSRHGSIIPSAGGRAPREVGRPSMSPRGSWRPSGRMRRNGLRLRTYKIRIAGRLELDSLTPPANDAESMLARAQLYAVILSGLPQALRKCTGACAEGLRPGRSECHHWSVPSNKGL